MYIHTDLHTSIALYICIRMYIYTCIFKYTEEAQGGHGTRDTGHGGATARRAGEEEKEEDTGPGQRPGTREDSQTALHARHPRHEHRTRLPGKGQLGRPSHPPSSYHPKGGSGSHDEETAIVASVHPAMETAAGTGTAGTHRVFDQRVHVLRRSEHLSM